MSVKLREKTLKDGRKRFYLDQYFSGKRTYQFLDIYINKSDTSIQKKEKIAIAQAIRSKVELDVARDGFLPKSTSFQKQSFIEFIDNYHANYCLRDVRMIGAAIKKFKTYISNKNLTFKDVNSLLLEDFCTFLTDPKNKLSGETAHNYFSRFKKVMNYAVKKGYLDREVVEVRFRGQSKNNRERKEILSADEIQLMASTRCGNEEIKKGFLFACFTGLGLKELQDLKWAEVANGVLKKNRAKTGVLINSYLNETALNILDNCDKKSEYIFQLAHISTNGVNKTLGLWVKRAGINKKLTFYCARHTYATQLLTSGTNLKTVSELLGHTEIKHTVKYLNYLEEDKRNAINRLPKIQFT
jgi:integrase